MNIAEVLYKELSDSATNAVCASQWPERDG